MKIPEKYKDVKKSKQRSEWMAAIQKELDELNETRTLKYITKSSLPKHAHWIDAKWVFNIKTNLDGSLGKFKADLVARKFGQIPGYEYLHTYSPTCQILTILIQFAIATYFGDTLVFFNFKQAHLNWKRAIEHKTYMVLPDVNYGVLVGVLYGTKDAGRIWNKLFTKLIDDATIIENSRNDGCMFTLEWKPIEEPISIRLNMYVYVDDCYISTNNSQALQALLKVLTKYKYSKHDGKKMLGIRFTMISKHKVHASMDPGIQKMLNKFAAK